MRGGDTCNPGHASLKETRTSAEGERMSITMTAETLPLLLSVEPGMFVSVHLPSLPDSGLPQGVQGMSFFRRQEKCKWEPCQRRS
jgi:hypothetical protein